MLPEIERQAAVLRASTGGKISLEGAYLERLVVNIYGGEGETEVYLDELTVGPVTPEVADAAGAEGPGRAGPEGPVGPDHRRPPEGPERAPGGGPARARTPGSSSTGTA